MQDLPRIGTLREHLATVPTPVDDISALVPDAAPPLFCKREDLSGESYGGNKVRKLEFLLAEARARGTEVLTVGAIGSHHVVATAWYGRRLGVRTHAVLGPQPDTPHVRQHAHLAAGLVATTWPLRSWSQLPLVLARATAELTRRLGAPPLVVPPGGSSTLGCLGSVALGLELAEDVGAGRLPLPDRVYVPVGSGGTAAGLWVGLRAAGLPTQVVGVRTAQRVLANQAHLRALAGRVRRHLGWRLALPLNHQPLVLDHSQVGAGYGHPTPAGRDAAARAAEVAGLELEQTYSAKALAGCLHDLGSGQAPGTTLFVATANSRPLAPLLAHAAGELPEALEALLTPA